MRLVIVVNAQALPAGLFTDGTGAALSGEQRFIVAWFEAVHGLDSRGV